MIKKHTKSKIISHIIGLRDFCAETNKAAHAPPEKLRHLVYW